MSSLVDPKDTATTEDGVTSAVADERRATTRLPWNLSLKLTGLGRTEVHRCATHDISEGGLYVRVPAKSGLAVGQRCEVLFEDNVDSAKPSSVVGEMRYATVVRTQRLTEGSTRVVGAGLRFDQPLFL